MDKEFFNSIPLQVKSGKMSVKEAEKLIWIEIYQNPLQYGLSTLDEDQTSDFLIAVSPRFKDFINNYKQGPVEFRWFIKSCLKNSVFTWLRKELKNYAHENCLSDQIKINYEIREPEDVEYSIADKNETPSALLLLQKLSEKRKSMAKEVIHLCACRACNEIDDEMINKIAGFLEINRSSFRKEIYSLRENTKIKVKKRTVIITRRNRAFFFHKKFFYELLRLDPDSAMFSILKERYNAQTENWQQINLKLQKRYSIYPSIKQIAQASGFGHRRVSFYLNHQKKRKEILPFIDFPAKYKNE